MTECPHRRTRVETGVSGFEAPYDITDLWWHRWCLDCNEVVEEGEGTPPTR